MLSCRSFESIILYGAWQVRSTTSQRSRPYAHQDKKIRPQDKKNSTARANAAACRRRLGTAKTRRIDKRDQKCTHIICPSNIHRQGWCSRFKTIDRFFFFFKFLFGLYFGVTERARAQRSVCGTSSPARRISPRGRVRREMCGPFDRNKLAVMKIQGNQKHAPRIYQTDM